MGKKLSALQQAGIENARMQNNYFNRLMKVALSIFHWENLPDSMNEVFLERCLFENGMAALLKDEDKGGFINTRCAFGGNLNIYNWPVALNCYAANYNTRRWTYQGDVAPNRKPDNYAVLIPNSVDFMATVDTIYLYAERLADAQRTCDVNIRQQKTPRFIRTTSRNKFTMQNVFLEVDGNSPAIFGDKDIMDKDNFQGFDLSAPYITDKVQDYKKQLMNEVLTYLGINNLKDKKERLVADEANADNEVINLNLQSFLAPRQIAAEQFNQLFKPDRPLKVTVRSDLENTVKRELGFSKEAENGEI